MMALALLLSVQTNLDFERSCRQVLQQMCHVQSFNKALRDRLGL